MIELRKMVVRLLVRLALAALATVYGRYLIVTAEAGVAGVSRLLAAMLCFVVAGLIFAPALVRFMAELSGDVFSSGGFGGSNSPYYQLAANKRMRGRYAEAMAELEKIAREHPRELRVYQEMLAIALTDLGDEEQARSICRRGRKALGNRKDLELLAAAFKKGCAAL